jgi:hypothetical protein
MEGNVENKSPNCRDIHNGISWYYAASISKGAPTVICPPGNLALSSTSLISAADEGLKRLNKDLSNHERFVELALLTELIRRYPCRS